MRYTIHIIANEDCTAIRNSVLAQSDNLDEAKRLAADNSDYAFGSAIRDNETGLIDYGMGFGVEEA
jgi:hypothetical protein